MKLKHKSNVAASKPTPTPAAKTAGFRTIDHHIACSRSFEQASDIQQGGFARA